MRCGTASVLPVFLPQSSGFGLADCSPAAWLAVTGAGHRLPSSLPQAQVRRGPWGSGGSAGWPPGLPHAWPKGLAGWILSWSRDRPRLSQPAVTLSACLTGVPLLEERLDFEDRSLGWLGSAPLGGLDVLTSSLPSSLASLVVFWFNLSSDSGSPEVMGTGFRDRRGLGRNLGALAWCWLSEVGERAAWVLGPIVGTQAGLPPLP